MRSTSPSPAAIRAEAAILVAGTATEGRSLDELLAGDRTSGSARGLKRSLVYGTLRWHFRLLELLRRLSDRPPEQWPARLRALLEVGLFQLVSGETAPHAAVAETVNAARTLGFPRAAGFVNAVLRRFQRERDALLEAVDADLAARTAHPRWFVSQLEQDYPGEAVAILEANNAHPPMWLRVNRRRTSVPECAEALVAAGYGTELHALASDALRIEPAADVTSLPGFREGWISVQDVAAQLAVELLRPRPGDRVLDACAAPGGKTCHVLERVPGVELTALDASAARLQRVRENLTRLGLEADVRAGDLAEPATWWDGRRYDRILLDVPCSATGVIRRHPDIKLLRRSEDIPALARRQARLLRSAWECLAPGGTLLYTSCSVLRAENESVIRAFLAETPGAADVTADLTREWPARPGGGGGPGYAFRPGEAGMDGFYYACLTRHP